MIRHLGAAALGLLLLAAAAPAGAQQTQIFRAGEMDPKSPVAVRVGQVVQLLLVGDREEAREHLAAHAGGALRDSATLEEQLDAALAALGTEGTYLLEGLASMGDQAVLARFRDTTGGPPLAIAFLIEPSPPHRITTVRVAQIQMRTRTVEPGP